MNIRLHAPLFALFLIAPACDSGQAADGGDGAKSGETGDGPDDGDSGESGEDGESGGDDDESIFIDRDVGTVLECNIWEQDCPAGEKCMPFASAGNSWDSLRCTAVNEITAAIGDTCTAEGGGSSGIDNCELGSMCWNVNPETSEGTCIALCAGNEADASCDDPTRTCVIANDGTLPVCLQACDPLLQGCDAENEACYPAPSTTGEFACAADVSGELGAIGDPCGAINTCDAGGFCANAAAVPGCADTGAASCCSPFCDFGEGESCALEGQECVPAYEDGTAPPGNEHIGFCVIPQ